MQVLSLPILVKSGLICVSQVHPSWRGWRGWRLNAHCDQIKQGTLPEKHPPSMPSDFCHPSFAIAFGLHALLPAGGSMITMVLFMRQS